MRQLVINQMDGVGGDGQDKSLCRIMLCELIGEVMVVTILHVSLCVFIVCVLYLQLGSYRVWCLVW